MRQGETMTFISKMRYPDQPLYPRLLRARMGYNHMPNDYPEGPVGEEMDRLHRVNRFVNQYGAVFAGGDHIARFRVHDFLGVRRRTMPVYLRGIEGLTLEQFGLYHGLFAQEVAPSLMFVSIGLEELKQPEFDPEGFANRVLRILQEMIPNCETLYHIYLMKLFPVCPEMATDETREALKVVTNQRIDAANAELAKLEAKSVRKLCYCQLHVLDLNGPLTSPEGGLRKYLSDDGLHLTADAYFRVFEQIKDLISESSGPYGSPQPEDEFLRMCGRMQALERYIVENGLASEEKIASIEAATGLREMSTNEKLGAMEHFLPPADLRELAKYIAYYAENPLGVLQKYEPERFMNEGGRIEFPQNGDEGGDEQ